MAAVFRIPVAAKFITADKNMFKFTHEKKHNSVFDFYAVVFNEYAFSHINHASIRYPAVCTDALHCCYFAHIYFSLFLII